ncbi:TetR/AcrR family transcriptional regulator [Bosea psychrotolerans]|uniref:TetR family transcriptional regulator n=1 Tax=Bosea psychrotolerans TaxID=1871628 RepID=A0A2S4M0E0_9HYPH|nr:TetR/AcrR family transcriptional regulator [Bosea psychrotolerans]POR48118.1 TetR family transcriptional regulator [Bosea psychrotolerans]
MRQESTKPEGLRERNRREKYEHITDVSIRLFLENGYDTTTLDEIAHSAGISRRNLFNYFDSKDEILFSHLREYYEMIAESIARSSPDEPALEVVRKAILSNLTRFDAERTLAIAKIMRNNAALQSKNRANEINLEKAIMKGLSALWPAKESHDRLLFVSILSSGAIRFATYTWLRDGNEIKLSDCVVEAFDRLKLETRCTK